MLHIHVRLKLNWFLLLILGRGKSVPIPYASWLLDIKSYPSPSQIQWCQHVCCEICTGKGVRIWRLPCPLFPRPDLPTLCPLPTYFLLSPPPFCPPTPPPVFRLLLSNFLRVTCSGKPQEKHWHKLAGADLPASVLSSVLSEHLVQLALTALWQSALAEGAGQYHKVSIRLGPSSPEVLISTSSLFTLTPITFFKLFIFFSP